MSDKSETINKLKRKRDFSWSVVTNAGLPKSKTGTAELVSFTERRTKTRQQSKVNSRLLKSLQTCLVKNKDKLRSLRSAIRGGSTKKRYNGLLSVIEHLMIPADYHDTSCFQENKCEDFTEQFLVKGYIEFDEALEIYVDVSQYDINDEKRSNHLRTAFKDALMDEESGLWCFIYTAINRKQYIVLDSDEIDLKSYFLELIEPVMNFYMKINSGNFQ